MGKNRITKSIKDGQLNLSPLKFSKVLLERKKSNERSESTWFFSAFSMFSILNSDYISLRLLYFLEINTTAWTILPKTIEVVEKSLKFFLMVNTKSTDSLENEYKHNIKKLLDKCATFDKAFEEAEIQQFAKDLNDKNGEFFQYLRYGSQSTTSSMCANIQNIIPVIDKIFFNSILLIPDGQGDDINRQSELNILLTSSPFSRFCQTKDKDLVIRALRFKNSEIDRYIDYCLELDRKFAELERTFARLDEERSLQKTEKIVR